MKNLPKINRNFVFSVILLAGIAFSVVTIVKGAAPDPGHNFSESSGGVAQGDLLYGSAADTLSTLAKDATASRYLSNTGASNNPAWAQVNLTNGVSGILPSANGGTANGFTKFTGPTTAEKTFTLPDASATILTSNSAVTAAQGGTGQTSYAIGDLLYADTVSTLAKLADVATGNALISGGVATAPSWGKIDLTTHVSGTLPIANGGTNSTATPTNGGVAYGTGSAYAFTAAGTANQVLISNGAAAPTWSTRVVCLQPLTTPGVYTGNALTSAYETATSSVGDGSYGVILTRYYYSLVGNTYTNNMMREFVVPSDFDSWNTISIPIWGDNSGNTVRVAIYGRGSNPITAVWSTIFTSAGTSTWENKSATPTGSYTPGDSYILSIVTKTSGNNETRWNSGFMMCYNAK